MRDLDQAVYHYLKQHGPIVSFTRIDSAVHDKRPQGPNGFRHTDRALQRLKKAGWLTYSRKIGWAVTK